MTVEQIYERTIKNLSAAERLRLATLILNDIPPYSMIDYKEEWDEEDVHDITRYSMNRAMVSTSEEIDDFQDR
ncbi:MAG: hypothetical protein C4527_19455 [Candidatus Omnitrophota bacterium]|jgi:Mg2+/Co2+ transporter CorC|nr:MAG: hypothetical protein C4527_19455 [Candidatus Omnitrophota bacterium]